MMNQHSAAKKIPENIFPYSIESSRKVAEKKRVFSEFSGSPKKMEGDRSRPVPRAPVRMTRFVDAHRKEQIRKNRHLKSDYAKLVSRLFPRAEVIVKNVVVPCANEFA